MSRLDAEPAATLVTVAVGAFSGAVLWAIAVTVRAIEVPSEGLPVLLDHAFSFGGLACAFAGAVVAYIAHRGQWHWTGAAALLALTGIVSGYLVYAATTSLPAFVESRPPFSQFLLSGTLFLLEALSLLALLAYAVYSLDAALRQARFRDSSTRLFSARYQPAVAFQVTVFNEPPAMVKESVDSILAVDYPAEKKHVFVLDDSTDAAAVEELRAYCEARGVRHLHRTDRRGFKAGALNDALAQAPGGVELVAVIDADYHVSPEFLRETVGYFADPTLGFVQTPQAYRESRGVVARAARMQDRFFYHGIMPTRNEGNAIIFCGTMGLIRREALVDAGGWGEEHVCEDAELSLRMLAQGWESLYVDRPFGYGLLPEAYAEYRGQQSRWSFGNVRALRVHLETILFGRLRRSHDRLTLRQKLDYTLGAVHWFDGVFVAGIALVLLLIGLRKLSGLPALTHHQDEWWLLSILPFLLLMDGAVRVHAGLLRRGRSRWRDTLLVIGLWMSTKPSNAFAALRGLFGGRAEFTRTPKAPPAALSRGRALVRALRVTPAESALAFALFGTAGALLSQVFTGQVAEDTGIARHIALTGWLAFYATLLATAPLFAYLSTPKVRTGFASFRPRAGGARQRSPSGRTS